MSQFTCGNMILFTDSEPALGDPLDTGQGTDHAPPVQPSLLACCQLRALPLGPSCCCDFVQISRELGVQHLEDSAGFDPEAPTLEIPLGPLHKSTHIFWLLHRTLPLLAGTQTSAQRATSPRKSSLTACPHGLTWEAVSHLPPHQQRPFQGE